MLNIALAGIYSFASNRAKHAQPEDPLEKSQARSSVHFQKPTLSAERDYNSKYNISK